MKIANLIAETKTAVITVGGGVLNIEYAPARITPATLHQIDGLAEKTPLIQLDGAIALMVNLLIAWDLQQDDESPVSITPAALQELPTFLLVAVLKGMIADAHVGNANGATPNAD